MPVKHFRGHLIIRFFPNPGTGDIVAVHFAVHQLLTLCVFNNVSTYRPFCFRTLGHMRIDAKYYFLFPISRECELFLHIVLLPVLHIIPGLAMLF